ILRERAAQRSGETAPGSRASPRVAARPRISRPRRISSGDRRGHSGDVRSALLHGLSEPAPRSAPIAVQPAGAGSARQRGVRAVLCDLSPAATFIAYNYNTPVDAAAFRQDAQSVLAQVEAECGWMYRTLHRPDTMPNCDLACLLVGADLPVCPGQEGRPGGLP